jgi:hypothetical protein
MGSFEKQATHVVMWLSLKMRTTFGWGLEGGYDVNGEGVLMSFSVLVDPGLVDCIAELKSILLRALENQATWLSQHSISLRSAAIKVRSNERGGFDKDRGRENYCTSPL